MIIGSSIEKKYKDNIVFNDFSFSIPDTGITIIKGKVGSGKTTLLNIICNRIKYDGCITIDDKEYVNNLSSINKIFFLTYNDFFDELTVEENFNFYLNDEEIYTAYEILNQVGLVSVKFDTIKYLSKGQKNLICFAISIARKAKYIFFDEINAGIDENHKAIIIEIIKQKAKEKAIIIATHDDSFFAIADTIVEIEGENAQEIFNQPTKIECFQGKEIENNIYKKNKISVIIVIINFMFIFLGFLINNIGFYSSSNNNCLDGEIYIVDYSNPSLDKYTNYSDNILCENKQYMLTFKIFNKFDCFIEEDIFIRNKIKGYENKLLDDEIAISSNLYKLIIEKTRNSSLKYEDIYFKNRKLCDVFENEKNIICFSNKGYWKYFGTRDLEINISVMQNNEYQNYDYCYTGDVLFLHLTNYFPNNKGLLIPGERKLIVNPKIDMQSLIKKMYEKYELDFFPLNGDKVELVSGTYPKENNEILLPSFLSSMYMINSNIDGYSVSGFYESDIKYDDGIIDAYVKPQIFYKNEKANDIIISSENDKDYQQIKNQLIKNGVSFEVNEDYFELYITLNENKNKFLMSFMLVIANIVCCYFIYTKKLKKYFRLCVNQGMDLNKLNKRELNRYIKLVMTTYGLAFVIENIVMILFIIAQLGDLNYFIFNNLIWLLIIITSISGYFLLKLIFSKYFKYNRIDNKDSL